VVLEKSITVCRQAGINQAGSVHGHYKYPNYRQLDGTALMLPRKQKKDSAGGYSLIEIVLVVVIITILAGFSFQALLSSVSLYAIAARDYLIAQQEGKIAMEKMVREIREAVPSNIVITSGSIQVTKRTGHGTPLDSNLAVTFVQGNSETKIVRQSAAGNFTLANNVVEDSFSANMDNNDVVTINFAIEAGENQYPLRTAVWPRQVPTPIGGIPTPTPTPTP